MINSERLTWPKRHPKHSLLRYLIVSSSLDLILDILLTAWSAVVGEHGCTPLAPRLTSLSPHRIFTPLRSSTDLAGFVRSISQGQQFSLPVRRRSLPCEPLFRTGGCEQGMAYAPLLRTH